MKFEEFIKKYGISSFGLKLLAITTMLIDHVGAVLFPQEILFRIIGRISFPIFCACVAEGAYYTSNIRKYETRLLAFAVLSEVPFNLAFYKSVNAFAGQNVFFTLFSGLLCIDILRSSEREIRFAPVVVLIGLAEVLHFDYGAFGVVLIILFYRFIHQRFRSTGVFLLFNTLSFGLVTQIYAGLAALVLVCYSGKKGPGLKWLFYLFYPLHLLVLWFLWYQKV